MVDYISLNDFALKEQFLESKERIPIDILEKIKPLSREISVEKWKYYIHSYIGGFLPLLPHISLNVPILSGFHLNIPDDVILVQQRLSELINLPINSKIFFFWNQFFSVYTEWGIFLKYWPSFCSDHAEGCILIFERDNRILIYSDEGLKNIIWIEDRKKLLDKGI